MAVVAISGRPQSLPAFVNLAYGMYCAHNVLDKSEYWTQARIHVDRFYMLREREIQISAL